MEEDEVQCKGTELWLLSYADLMTLLFAAFVVLYGITPQGKSDTVLGAISSVREAFMEIPDDIPADIVRDGPIVVGKATFKYFKGELTRPPIIKKYKRAQKALNIINKDIAEAEAFLTLKSKQGMDNFSQENAAKDISIHQDPDGFKIRLVASYFYGPGEFRLKTESLARIKSVADYLHDLGRRITIEGHSDNSPPKKDLSNLQISSLRSGYLAKYFIDNLNFPNELVNVAAYGDLKPIAPNDTEAGRAANRRIEIKIHYDDEP